MSSRFFFLSHCMQTRRKSSAGKKRARNEPDTPRQQQPVRKSSRKSKPTAKVQAVSTALHQSSPAVKRSSNKKCTPFVAVGYAEEILDLLRERKAAETTATRLDKKVRALDTKIWRLYDDIVKGTCSVAKYRHMFEAVQERMPLERQMEDAKKRMLVIDDEIRAKKHALYFVIKNTERYVGEPWNALNAEFENLR